MWVMDAVEHSHLPASWAQFDLPCGEGVLRDRGGRSVGPGPRYGAPRARFVEFTPLEAGRTPSSGRSWRKGQTDVFRGDRLSLFGSPDHGTRPLSTKAVAATIGRGLDAHCDRRRPSTDDRMVGCFGVTYLDILRYRQAWRFSAAGLIQNCRCPWWSVDSHSWCGRASGGATRWPALSRLQSHHRHGDLRADLAPGRPPGGARHGSHVGHLGPVHVRTGRGRLHARPEWLLFIRLPRRYHVGVRPALSALDHDPR